MAEEEEEWISHFQQWFNTAHPHLELRRKGDVPPFVCYHQLKDMGRDAFIDQCCNLCAMANADRPADAPENLGNVGFCMQCAIDIFVKSCRFSMFLQFIDVGYNDECVCKRLRLKGVSLPPGHFCDVFSAPAQCIRIFLYVCGIPSIFKRIMSTKALFLLFLVLMMKSELILADWLLQMQSDQQHRHNTSSWSTALWRHDEFKQTMSMLFHSSRSNPHHFKWGCELIRNLWANERNEHKQYHVLQRHEHLMRNPHEISSFNHFYLYLPLVVGGATFSSLAQHFKKYRTFYSDCVPLFRERIFCGNSLCAKRYYGHKNAGLKWFKCKRCQIVYYCSKRCQKYDWARMSHRSLCKQLSY